MALKDILVVVDEAGKPEQPIQAAIDLARASGAHLTGLYVAVEASWPLYAYGPVPRETIDLLQARADAAAAKAKETFTAVVSKSDLSIDFRTEVAPSAVAQDTIAVHARHADLVVIGQSDPDRERPAGNELPEEVIFQCGRPVLVVPYVGLQKPFGRRVMVGWDGSREAVRALNDALPILQKAEKVVVIVVNPKPGSARHGQVPGADIALHLARHGVHVEVAEEDAKGVTPDQVILSRVADMDIDLLVLGAYGTPRLQERMFGGVTRTIMQSMTVPVLFSH
ncbi:MAG: universal stress protein [Pseudomonadota bacterium]|nr:universal stress protein [Pseudomonadota bacterium]